MFKQILFISRFCIFLVFGYLIGQGGLNTWVHESGHYLSTKLFYEECDTRMFVGRPFSFKMLGVFPSTPGMTTHAYDLGCQTRPFITDRVAFPLTGYAGGMATVLFSIMELAAAQFLRKRWPNLGLFLIAQALTGLGMEALYAGLADSGDYLFLEHLVGVPRLVPFLVICLLPLLTWFTLQFLKTRPQPKSLVVSAEECLGSAL